MSGNGENSERARVRIKRRTGIYHVEERLGLISSVTKTKAECVATANMEMEELTQKHFTGT